MQVDKLSKQWLFKKHSKETVKRWMHHLKYFYFIRAWGGHANDGDFFMATIHFGNTSDLLQKLAKLDIILPTFFLATSPAIPGPAYAKKQVSLMSQAVELLTEKKKIGRTNLWGKDVLIDIQHHILAISVSGTKDQNYFEVSEEDYEVCLFFEEQFDRFAWESHIDRSIEKNVCCISEKRYPELY